MRPHPLLPGTRGTGRARAAAFLLAVGTLTGCGPTDQRPPDIVLYVVDTLRRDRLGVYGYERDTSPHLDRMARDSVVFQQACTPASWTRPATASLLTGLDPLDHGARSRPHGLPAQLELISERLQDQGYYTVGVVTNANVVQHWGFVQGYDEFVDVAEAMAARTEHEVPWTQLSAKVVHAVVSEILQRRPKDRPLFLYVHTIDPHAPYDPPAPYNQTFSKEPGRSTSPDGLAPGAGDNRLDNLRNQYDGEIRFQDEVFGRFLEELRREGIYDDAMLWFVSDHGDEHLEHGRGGHGKQLFEEVLRVPMVWKLPEQAHAGLSVEVPVSLLDVVPTTLAWLGLDPGEGLAGVDLGGCLEGAPPGSRPLFFDLDLNSGIDMKPYVARGVLYEGYKYVEELLPRSRQMLFQLTEDPHEQRNLIDARPELAEELRAMLTLHQASHRGGTLLQLASDPDAPDGGCVVHLRTDGTFSTLEGVSLEDGDRIELGEDGSTATATLRVADYMDNLSGNPTQDVDTLRIAVSPPESLLIVESVELRGGLGSLPVQLGMARTPGVLPLSLFANDPGLLLPDQRELFGQEKRVNARVPPGLYIVQRPDSGSLVQEDMPEHVRRQLEALGYLEGG